MDSMELASDSMLAAGKRAAILDVPGGTLDAIHLGACIGKLGIRAGLLLIELRLALGGVGRALGKLGATALKLRLGAGALLVEGCPRRLELP